ncbi:helix-turn-helix transcriptional regulator [Sphingorhabdus sp.]|jgi:phage repressor protein C with HTH and peptisase S24 domain|uniref:helix-turn-helix transcriptional regulator n=1 Tax=Sphingorhabdus sp. TaxID=1902408 RepID=UPI0037CC27A2
MTMEEEPRAALERLILESGEDFAGLSKLVGRNPAYIQQFIKRGTPKKLPETERGILARYFGVDETLLGKSSDAAVTSGIRLIPKLAVGASAGAGAIHDGEALAGKIGFDEKWLRRMGLDPAKLSLIRVDGESMSPTLNHGDDIMVDNRAAAQAVRDGIHVIRLDDMLMVKRLAQRPRGRLSVLSDNPNYPDWPDVDGATVTVIGRVVWAGRRL